MPVSKKRPNVRQLVERMDDGMKRRTLNRIEDQGSMSDFLGIGYDEKLYDQVVYHLKAALGEY